MTTTTATATAGADLLWSARDILGLVLCTPDVSLLSVETRGLVLDPKDPTASLASGVDLDVMAAGDWDAEVLAEHWDLTEQPTTLRPSSVGTRVGEYIHRSWTGTTPTLDGLMRLRVRTCRYLPPQAAALPSSPTH